MNAAFDKQFTQALQLVASQYQQVLRKVIVNPEQLESVRKVMTSFMDKLLENKLISSYQLDGGFQLVRQDYRKGPRSPYPANPNYLSIPRITDTLNAFLKEQDKLNEEGPDDSWYRFNERQLTQDIARNFRFTGLIKDYYVGGDKVGVVAQDPKWFLSDQQRARFNAHSQFDSPSP
ncbi:hypothetical protein [Pseudomonas amygdali]|uniref:Uncharacterized protein n=2 Tax=Pseudomonas amygdali pv. lachrymans TaxID=53707 RepID=A0ABR5KTC8_PSEAV|nr:hypothetical protein [Pseudomonas amygdali]AXH59688.1 hypothetical protein PLA107_031185 [Pseudomonas amygdali pv. lachrymans str. M301315]KPC17114.1 Uncharacterized protein AC499_0316 [Pseudomonas amygdali pv. lachrymans]KPC18073.1 Uncharacterized protein AC499_1275 [Pseudomonas amygdali pv. lachrymans]RMT05907.1 hypothetical protein ALP54_03596 [Pseudomonas amygdali pv. lachrymans]